jgi:hypothetical protein
MENVKLRFKFSDLNLCISDVEQVIGYEKGEAPKPTLELIERAFETAEKTCKIKAEYIVYPNILFQDIDKTLEISNIRFEIKEIVYEQIIKSESIAVFFCTAGKEFGNLIKKSTNKGDLLEGYIYDVIGSTIAEATADLMQNDLKAGISRNGKKITNRYSPGFCGWDVAEQHKLFQLVPDNYCRIKLTESALMDPLKSVSGIIGIGENVRFNPYTCRLCGSMDCTSRKIKEKREIKY